MQGLHLTADLFDCRDPDGLMVDGERLGKLCDQLAREAGLTVVGRHFHAFPPAEYGLAGWTGVLLLAESHLAIHTWPERHAVTLDVFVCNFGQDNSLKAHGLIDALVARFHSAHAHRQQLVRGVPA
jgi:S-adenosylmethionine decarboxylase proenzyme